MFVPHTSPTEVFSSHHGSPPDFNSIEAGLSEQVGQNMRVVRSHLGQSQQHLAQRIGVSLSQYRKYEGGKDLPRLHSALLWSIETGVPTHWLFHDTGYQRWLNVPFNQHWVPIFHFINRASPWALQAFQSVLTGMLGCYGETHQLISLQKARQALSGDLIRDHYYHAVSEKLRQYRQNIGLSQDAAAQIMDISTEAYRRYETPNRCTHFSINLVMRFWVATGTNPVELSSETLVFQYREKQRDNFRIILPLLEQLDSAQLNQLSSLMEVLEALPGAA